MSKQIKPLKVEVVNPPSKEHADELIRKINDTFKAIYSSKNMNMKNKTTKIK